MRRDGGASHGAGDAGLEAAASLRSRISLEGLSSHEANVRLRESGPNTIAEEVRRPWRALVAKLWAPVPAMLAGAIVLEWTLGRSTEAIFMAALLVFNVGLSFFQEQRAQGALALLRQQLVIQARVLRDGKWQGLPAADLVPGDVIHLQAGDLVPADVQLSDGAALIDQSALTGEALPVEVEPGATANAGTMVKGGGATGQVTATGFRTAFGRTAELVRVAKTPSHLEAIIMTIVRYLIALDLLLVVALLGYAHVAGLPLTDVAPFALILLVASVPVALPATFTLASALGTLELAHHGVLVTHLAAIEEAAGLEVLCTDKTGTLTENRLQVADLHPYPPHTRERLLELAAIASDPASQDPIDRAILAAAVGQGVPVGAATRLSFTPFEPATRRATASVRIDGELWEVTKGAPAVIVSAVAAADPRIEQDVTRLAAQGHRVLAVAAGPAGSLRVIGLVALEDPVRPDAKALVERLQGLGIRVQMVTGDNLVTAQSVAAKLGLGGRACQAEVLRGAPGASVLECDIFARVFPEDKFRLVQTLQQMGKVVGMTGDGVNDAPALKQAEVGIAVSGATDAARAAASLVLTTAGLSEIVAALETSRRIYQRLTTYTLNKIIKTIQISLLLSLGLILGGAFVTSPRLVVLLLFANDFVTMAIATDRVTPPQRPSRWDVSRLLLSAACLALPLVVLSFGVVWAVRDGLGMAALEVQTAVFVWLVFSGQATVYLCRERGPFWRSLPSRWLGLSSLADIMIVSLLASQGWLMAAIPWPTIAGLLAVSAAFLVAADGLKVRIFRAFGLS